MSKRLGIVLVVVVVVTAVVFAMRPGKARSNQKAEHAVIFIIDGLSHKAVDKLPLNNLRGLIQTGSYCEKSYNILPAHFRTGAWAQYHTSSIPNPVILAGTVLLRTDQQYVQESFFPDRLTAHAANDIDYRRLNVGFNLTFLNGSGTNPVHDDQTIAWAMRFLREAHPAFMKVHLQDTGNAGVQCFREEKQSVPWRQNIWANGSPYVQAAIKADEYLGMFLRELKALGLADKTVLFVTADHGQSDHGWHPFDDADACVMPLVVAGPGIRAGQKLAYAEQIDIVPTLCYLSGVKPPANAAGRILAEALTNPPSGVPQQTRSIPELNKVLLEGGQLIRKLQQDAEKSPAVREKLAMAERDFYGIERILEWHRFGSIEKLVENDRLVLQQLAPNK